MLQQSDLLRSLFGPLSSGHYSFWVVAIEWLLIGIPIYVILRFLQGTRGARLVWGVGLILAVSVLVMNVVGQRFELERINLIYRYVVLALIMIALVVFQPELRRGLMRIGERGWLTWTRGTQRVIERSSTRRPAFQAQDGALIAIERTTSLGAVSESGVEIDGTVSAELIQTVFWPGSALHDMGMIIQGERIVAAGCQFPLADSEEVDRVLGSRHRAAVGMSQECDAIVIVVSEETGAISIAEHGRLRRAVSAETLRKTLLGAFAPEAEEPPKPEAEESPSQRSDCPAEVAEDESATASENRTRLRQRKAPNVQQLKLILVTVVLTFVIWSTADQLLTDLVDVTVTVKPAPTGDPRIIVETVPAGRNTFQIRLEGPRRLVEQVRQEGLGLVSLPVRDQPNGVYRIDVQRELSVYPEPFRGLRIVSVEPSHVQVAIDRLVTETMPVAVRTGALEYEVPPTAEPAQVEVTMRQSVLDTLGPQDRCVYVEVESLLGDRPEGVALEIPGVPIEAMVGGA